MARKLVALVVAMLLLCAGLLYSDAIFNLRLIAGELRSEPATQPKSSSVPQIGKCERCNVVVVMLDTFRADYLGVLSSQPTQTPNLDAIAQRGVLFRNAFTNAFYTTPSHATIFTSLYPQTHQVVNRKQRLPRIRTLNMKFHPLASRYTTLAQELNRHGYTTIATAPQKFNHLEESLGMFRGFKTHVAPIFPRAINRKKSQKGFDAAGWKAIEKKLKPPFFLFVHSYIAHLPYVSDEQQPTAPFPISRASILDEYYKSGRWSRKSAKERDEGIGPDALAHSIGAFQVRSMTRALQGAEADERAKVAQAYAANVRDLDEQIGKFWREIEKIDNTIFIFISDHGEELFEHGEGSHSSFYDQILRIPWFMLGPGTQPGIVDNMVSLVDLMPTVLDIVGVESPKQTQGVSLLNNPAQDLIFGFTLGMDFIRSSKWKLLTNAEGSPELYYLPLDPGENKNLIDSWNWKVRDQKRYLEGQIEAWKLRTALQ